MLLAEELTLLALDDDSGRPLLAPDDLTRAIAMALVFELSVRRATELSPEGTIVAGPSQSSGDPLLDLTAEHAIGHSPTAAVQHLSTQEIAPALIARLTARGLIEESAEQPGLHPASDHAVEAGVRARLEKVLVGGDEPSAHDIALIALLDHVHLTKTLFAGQDAEAAARRAQQISEHWNEMAAFRDVPNEPDGSAPDRPAKAAALTGGVVGVAGAAVAADAAAAVGQAQQAGQAERSGSWIEVAEAGIHVADLGSNVLQASSGIGSLLESGGEAFGALVEGAKGMTEGLDLLDLVSLPFRIFE